MKNRLPLFLAVLAACTTKPPETSAPAPAPAEHAPSSATADTAPAEVAKPGPELGTFGFDDAGMDKSVAPGDDFFRFANGKWFDAKEIPADREGYNMFIKLDELSKARTRELIEAIATSDVADADVKKAGDLFASFMDEATVEKAGAAPLKPELDAIAAISSAADVARSLGKLGRTTTTPINLVINNDDKQPDTYIASLWQSGLGMPDRDYYLKNDKKLVEQRAKYQVHIANMLRLAAIADPEEKAKGIYELELKIARAHWSQEQSRDADKVYNKWKRDDFAKKAPGLDWAAYMHEAGVAEQPTFIVAQPSAIAAVARLVSTVPVATWRDYLSYFVIKGGARYLSKAFVDENFAFNGTVLWGMPQNKERWKRGVDLVSTDLGEAIGKAYVAKYFPPAAKARADELVKNLIVAMGARLDTLTWMTPATKAKAKEKLASFTTKIGYPKTWRDYSALTVKRDDLYGNVQRATEFEYDRNLKKLGTPVDRDEWFMTPMTVNAYANPVMNEIVFPAAILQPPYFDANADDAINYGAIGGVIGHEISHHFDDQGRKYDAKGALTEWWTKTDVTRFEALTKKVVKQYDAYEALPGMHVNGKLTLGENIADLAGLTVAFDAYHRAANGAEPRVIDGYSGDQRFFLGWAQAWRAKFREETIRGYLLVDPHAPDAQRAQVVRNLDAWYTAFDVMPGAKLYLPPEQRARLW